MSIMSALRKQFPNLREVRDATKRLAIEVTPRDESAAKKKHHKECAMALACRRKMNLDGVLISRSRAYLVKDNVATRYDLPIAVQKEVISFDRGGGFDIGGYELLKPGHKLGETHGNGGGHASTAKMRAPRHLTGKIRTVVK